MLSPVVHGMIQMGWFHNGKGLTCTMTTRNIIAVSALALGLAACQSGGFGPGPAMQQQPRGIEGQWVDPNGIISSFSAGRFETRTTDTGTLLAEGNYQQVSSRMVEIELTSLLRKTTSRVNCALVTQNQLNCTSSTGSQFTLVRQSMPTYGINTPTYGAATPAGAAL